MSDMPFADNPISRALETLDLRDTRTHMQDSRNSHLMRRAGMRTSPPSRPAFRVATSPLPAREALVSPRTRSPPPTRYVAPVRDSTASNVATARAVGVSSASTPSTDRSAGHDLEPATRASLLEASLSHCVGMFVDHVVAVESSVGSLSQYYAITFGPGHIGMILTSTEAGDIVVAELRDDPATGKPLMAAASGKVSIGDHVLAVGNDLLARYGPPAPERVAAAFRHAKRPVTVLFKRHDGARALASSVGAA